MTKRYFYTCPIKALYMMKEFGIRFLVGDQGHYGYKQCLPYTLEHLTNHHTFGKFYVATESEAIFETKEFDLIGMGVALRQQEGADLEVLTHGKLRPVFDYEHIRERSGKHFFMPEVEEVGNG